jgi:hypothetical protein
MVDVMRGAIAEVEDYARVSVATRSQAALTGSAVADVIHLLAELIENATTLSPPYTSVRVSGDTVANGFAIEVEDRGLGMSPSRLAELNDRLANPPEFNPSDSEQLGLFVVSQLAKRHGVRVTLKASPYGGTAAIVLIPRHLVVTEEAFRAGLPGEPASATMAQLTTNGNHADQKTPAELAGAGGSDFTEVGGGLAQTPGVRISGPLRRSQGIIPERFDRGAHAAPALGPANGTAGTGPDNLSGRHHNQPGAPAAGLVPNGAGAMPDSGVPSAFDVFTPRRPAQGTGETPLPADAGSGPSATGPGAPYPGNGSYIASPSFPASGSSPYPTPGSGPVPGAGPASGAGAAPFPGTGSAPFPEAGSASFPGRGSPSYPGAGPAPYPDQPAPFPGWNLHNTPGAGGGRTAPGPGTPAGPATPMTPVASPRPGSAAGPPWELPREPGPDGSAPGRGAAESDGNDDLKGLPRRVRQASLAPQLRDSPPPRRTTVASAGAASGSIGSTGPSPAEIRQNMSALQRGWQEGRAQRMADSVSGSSGPEPSGGGTGDSTTDEEARGSSDGS